MQAEVERLKKEREEAERKSQEKGPEEDEK